MTENPFFCTDIQFGNNCSIKNANSLRTSINDIGVNYCSKPNIKHIIFDFGGVLSQKTYILKKLENYIKNILNLNHFNNLIKDCDKVQLRRGLISEYEFIKKIGNKSNRNLNHHEIINIINYWVKICKQHTKINPIKEMYELVKDLKLAGYKVSILSNTYGLKAQVNKESGLYILFDKVFLSYEIGEKKPFIEIYEYVLELLKEFPEEILFIDNKLENLIPAKILGIHTLLLDNNVFSMESFKKFIKKLDNFDIYNSNPNPNPFNLL